MEIPTIPGTGTSGGQFCSLPFVYEASTFFACTYTASKVSWCATSESASQWGQCEVDAPGSFPKSLPALVIDDVDPSTLPPYNRKDWPHWTTKNCQTTRTRVLIQESITNVTFTTDSGCTVGGGFWFDFYTGETFTDPSQLDIDHLVPLQNAHVSGGWQWPTEKKKQYANELDFWEHLIAVKAAANRAKGSKSPDQWKPPSEGYWCEYAVRWILIKSRWNLSSTTPEHAALTSMIESCPIKIPWAAALSSSRPLLDGASETLTGSSAGLPGLLGVMLFIVAMAMILFYRRSAPSSSPPLTHSPSKLPDEQAALISA